MQKSNIAFGSIFAAIGVVFVIGALRLGLSSPTSDGVPGAGFFPFIIALVVLALGLGLVISSIISPDGRPSPFRMDAEQRENLRPFVLTIVALFGFFVLWYLIRFEVAAFVFCIFLNKVYKRSWLFTIVFSVILVSVTYFIFNRLLFIQFDI